MAQGVMEMEQGAVEMEQGVVQLDRVARVSITHDLSCCKGCCG